MIKFHTSLPAAMKRGKFWIFIGATLGSLGSTLSDDIHKIYCVGAAAVIGAFGAGMDGETKPEDKPDDGNISNSQ